MAHSKRIVMAVPLKGISPEEIEAARVDNRTCTRTGCSVTPPSGSAFCIEHGGRRQVPSSG